jgi:NhaA family Na+:H+ antiporter
VSSRIALGIVLARVVGKPVGIVAASAVAVRLGARMPSAVRMRHIVAVGAAAGVPFAVSLFVAQLALPSIPLYRATIGILSAAVIAGVAGGVLIRRETR